MREVSEPCVEDVLGHFFDGSEVHIVFRGTDGEQFILMWEGEERKRLCGQFLEEGCRWGRRDGGQPGHRGHYSDDRKAIHEAGHAVICVDEGVRVEYVTVVPRTAAYGERQLGYCCYDYRLRELRKTDPGAWAAKVARATLGGPEAERVFWERTEGSLPDDSEVGWSQDLSRVKEEIVGKDLLDSQPDYPSCRALLNAPDVLAAVERLRGAVRERLLDPKVWAAVERVAVKVRAEGAIDCEVVKQLVGHLGGG